MKIKIGITEAGDAARDLSWVDKLFNNEVDGAVLISKNILVNNFISTLCSCFNNKQNIILHSTITGMPRIYEPNSPLPRETIKELIKSFPKEYTVIRIDPIIPTIEGINYARKVFKFAANAGYKRFRISVIDMYPHVRERFKEKGLLLPYGENFSPSNGQLRFVDNMLREIKKEFPDISIESCAEDLKEAKPIGCVSSIDLELMGLDISNENIDSIGFQRKNCRCYSGKVELLNHRRQCPNQCVYCYWR